MKELSKKESEFLRGIAALLVVVAHYCQWYSLHTQAGMICMLLSKLGPMG